jgi:hypothetical protein
MTDEERLRWLCDRAEMFVAKDSRHVVQVVDGVGAAAQTLLR